LAKFAKIVAMIIFGAIILQTIGIDARAASITLQITSDNLDALIDYPETAYSGENLLWSYGQTLDANHKIDNEGYIQLADDNGNYWGECVSACKALAKSDATTSQWKSGTQAVAGSVSSGTVIATFSGSIGGFISGNDHAVIFKDYVYDDQKQLIGIEVWDQRWPSDNRVLRKHKIFRIGAGVNNADNYYTVLVPVSTHAIENKAETNVRKELDKLKEEMNSFIALSKIFTGSSGQASAPALNFNYQTIGAKYCTSGSEASDYMASNGITESGMQEALYMISYLGLERTGFCIVLMDYTYSAFGTVDSMKYPIVCNENGEPYWQSWQLYEKLNQLLSPNSREE
jgi:hypothetical protein